MLKPAIGGTFPRSVAEFRDRERSLIGVCSFKIIHSETRKYELRSANQTIVGLNL
jgi:hypothetical protein